MRTVHDEIINVQQLKAQHERVSQELSVIKSQLISAEIAAIRAYAESVANNPESSYRVLQMRAGKRDYTHVMGRDEVIDFFALQVSYLHCRHGDITVYADKVISEWYDTITITIERYSDDNDSR